MTGLKYSPDRGKGGRWNSRKKPGSIKSQARRSKMMNFHVSFVLGLCNEVKSSAISVEHTYACMYYVRSCQAKRGTHNAKYNDIVAMFPNCQVSNLKAFVRLHFQDKCLNTL